MDDVNQPNYDYLADIQDILLKMDGILNQIDCTTKA